MRPLRHAVRALWTRPQLSLVAIALLALGIGANTTVFARVRDPRAPRGTDRPDRLAPGHLT